MEITKGKKIGRPTAARFMVSKTGTKGIEIAFLFTEPSTGVMESLNWTGWINAAPKPGESEAETQERSRKNLERTMDTLVNVLGFNGNCECDAESVLTDPHALAYNEEVELDVALEEYKGKYYPKLQWVNKIGGGKFAACNPQTIKSELKSLGWDTAFLVAKQNKQPDAKLSKEVPF